MTALEPLQKLTKDLRAAAVTLSENEIRYLVDAYYMLQENRKRCDHQQRTLTEAGEPHEVIGWLAANNATLERNIKNVLDRWTDGQALGQWAKATTGIGPVIAAGLMTHLHLDHCPTVGHFWSFAGLNPTAKWEKGKKRPWNADLKRLCWLIGESFVKVSGLESDTYGKVWAARKEYEERKNAAGDYAEQARVSLATKDFGRDTQARKWYEGAFSPALNAAYRAMDEAPRTIAATQNLWELAIAQRKELDKMLEAGPVEYDSLVKICEGLEKMTAGLGRAGFDMARLEWETGVQMLPPARIHLRAERYAVKLFLSGFHEAAYFLRYGKLPPKPYAHEHLGHVHYFGPPNVELIEGWAEARRAAGRV